MAQRTKLTLVSVNRGYRGRSVFMHLPVDKDGKVRIDTQCVQDIFGVRRGECFGIG